MKRFTWKALMTRYPALFALILLLLALIVNFILQPNMFARDTLNSNMRVFLPIILLSAGQAVVILGGGIDISVGAIVSIVNTILATRVGLAGSPEAMWQYVALVPAGRRLWQARLTAFSSPTCGCSPSSPRTPPVFSTPGSRCSSSPIPAAASRPKLRSCTAAPRRWDCRWPSM